jgi:hypothetical protein
MAKRRHSVRRHKRAKTRASSKRGGDFTPDEGPIKPYVPFYNTETGKPTNTNVEFLDPTKISDIKKNTDQVFPGIFEKPDIAAEEVFNQEPGYFSKDSVDKRKRTAAAEEYDKLMNQYETDVPKPATKQICNEETGAGCTIMGGLRRRKNSRQKTFKRKTFKRKTFKRKSRRY